MTPHPPTDCGDPACTYCKIARAESPKPKED